MLMIILNIIGGFMALFLAVGLVILVYGIIRLYPRLAFYEVTEYAGKKGGDTMLTKNEKLEILKYHARICHYVIKGRENSQRVPAGKGIWATRRFEGRLLAIRALVDLLGLPKDFLPNQDSIIV